METIIFAIIILIISFNFVLEQILGYFNIKHSQKELPEEAKNIFENEKYFQQQKYLKVNYKFEISHSSFSLLLILLAFFLGAFSLIDNFLISKISYPILISLSFFGILFIISDLLNTPFSIYHTFTIEEKFGFNKTTKKTFLLDKIKGWLLAIILGGGILSLIIWLYNETGHYFWLLAWGTVVIIMIFMLLFYSNLIVPLFNKQTPLEDGELRTEIEKYSQKTGFKLKNIYVINGSKRSTKANAYFTGFGAKKRIVLYDTLINDLTTNEIVAVLAHEVGHYKNKHVLQGLIISILETGFLFFLLSQFLKNPIFSFALGASQPSFHMGLIAFGLLYSPISLITGSIGNILSRKNEYQADSFAKNTYDGEALISALKKLSSNNLSNLTPHPAYVFFHYSHPPLLKRIEALKNK